MAVSLLAHEVADLCLGKPPLRSISVSATVADALAALKISEENHIGVWSCDNSRVFDATADENCSCVGKICMVDIICYLCKKENISSPSSALNSPVSVLLSKAPGLVRHVEPSSSLLEAIDLMLKGAQNLVVPIKSHTRKKQFQKPSTTFTNHDGREFCWLTHEDVIRFLLSSIGLFSPIPAFSIETLGIISAEFSAIGYYSPASSAVGAISRSLSDQKSVAVVNEEGVLIGEISPFTLACCEETVTAAITTLTAGDLMAYIDCGGPPEELVRRVKAKLKERHLEAMLADFSIASSDSILSNSNSSSDEESVQSPTAALSKTRRLCRSSSYTSARRAEAIVCQPGSSLVAVMIQAIAYRVNYIWVIEEDCTVAGIVTFSDMLKVFREHL